VAALRRPPLSAGGIQFHQNRFDGGLQSPRMQWRVKSRRAEPSPTEWVDRFRTRGYRHSRFMAAGMEGLVFRLGDGLVAKVWSTKPQTGRRREATGLLLRASPA
jgi:hypothetical protein